MKARLRPLVLALAALALPACRDLPDIARGTCGNGIVEAGEDCDTFAPSGHTCGSPGAVGACRLVCTPGASTSGCPAGWGCGLDAICRAPSGRFVAVAELVESGSSRLRVGDMDGDGRVDVVAESPGDVLGRRTHRIHFFDDAGRLSKTLVAPAQLSGADVGDVTADGIADLVGASGLFESVATFAGSASRVVSPVAYPSITVPQGSSVRALTMPTLPSIPGDDTLVFGTSQAPEKPVLALAPSGDFSNALLVVEGRPELLAGNPRIAAMIDGAPCEQIVFGVRGATTVRVFTPCRNEGPGVVYNSLGPKQVPAAEIALPAGAQIGASIIVGDVDADGHLDVVVNGSGASYVAYGDGKGAFYPTPDKKAGAGTASLFHGPDDTDVLAVGHLDGDVATDFVTGRGLYLGPGKGASTCIKQLATPEGYCLVGVNFGALWTEAILADVTRDGHADVVASSAGSTNVYFFGGSASGEMNPSTISTLGAVSDLVARDLDGDGVLDVAFAQAGTHGGTASATQGDSLAVLFGRAFAPPEAPSVIGRFDRIEQVIGGHFASIPPKAAEDVGLISRSEDGSELVVAIFSGSGDRVLLAPLGLQILDPPNATVQARPVSTLLARLKDAASPPELVALAYDDNGGGGGNGPPAFDKETFRLWSATEGKKGRFASLTRGPRIPAGITPFADSSAGTTLLAGDLDGDGRDEVLFLGVDVTSGNSSLVIATAGADRTLTPGAAASLGRFAPPGARAVLADVDGDKRLDLVLATRSVQSGADLAKPATELTVFWGTAGSFDLASPTVVATPAGATEVRDVAVRREASGLSLVLLTDAGTHVIARAGRTFTVAETAIGGGGTGVAVADLTGDGIEDVAIVQGGTVRVLRGEAVVP